MCLVCMCVHLCVRFCMGVYACVCVHMCLVCVCAFVWDHGHKFRYHPGNSGTIEAYICNYSLVVSTLAFHKTMHITLGVLSMIMHICPVTPLVYAFHPWLHLRKNHKLMDYMATFSHDVTYT